MKPLKERFEEKFVRLAPDKCWPWIANKNNMGYGMIREGGTLPKVLAHRVSYSLYKGPIPNDKIVMHDCDNPACVNPEHLVLGTQLLNIRDRGRKNRANNGHVTPVQAAKVSGLMDLGLGPSAAARAVGVSTSAAKHISAGQSHCYLRPELPATKRYR